MVSVNRAAAIVPPPQEFAGDAQWGDEKSMQSVAETMSRAAS